MSAPRKRLNPSLAEAVYMSGRTRKLAPLVRLSHARFAALIESDTVIATHDTVKRLHQIAGAVGFARDRVFLDDLDDAEVAHGE